ncbi:unnamed protein product [Boreogadus saida]
MVKKVFRHLMSEPCATACLQAVRDRKYNHMTLTPEIPTLPHTHTDNSHLFPSTLFQGTLTSERPKTLLTCLECEINLSISGI